jgi:hypothetical protein
MVCFEKAVFSEPLQCIISSVSKRTKRIYVLYLDSNNSKLYAIGSALTNKNKRKQHYAWAKWNDYAHSLKKWAHWIYNFHMSFLRFNLKTRCFCFFVQFPIILSLQYGSQTALVTRLFYGERRNWKIWVQFRMWCQVQGIFNKVYASFVGKFISNRIFNRVVMGIMLMITLFFNFMSNIKVFVRQISVFYILGIMSVFCPFFSFCPGKMTTLIFNQKKPCFKPDQVRSSASVESHKDLRACLSDSCCIT